MSVINLWSWRMAKARPCGRKDTISDFPSSAVSIRRRYNFSGKLSLNLPVQYYAVIIDEMEQKCKYKSKRLLTSQKAWAEFFIRFLNLSRKRCRDINMC
mmetsp:Transcript_42022/g.98442  ORF Transcript_42022/g.98442 Transcript_42022/m.98442 type:complete len:99 (+) Transcript_42022:1522-1818(+)